MADAYVNMSNKVQRGAACNINTGSQKRTGTSSTLQMNDKWTDLIGYDPYGGGDKDYMAGRKKQKLDKDQATNLFKLANLTGIKDTRKVGVCKHCGQMGHLPSQCRNNIKLDADFLAKATGLKKPLDMQERDLMSSPFDESLGDESDDKDSDFGMNSDLDKGGNDSDSDSNSSSSSDRKARKKREKKKAKKEAKKRKKMKKVKKKNDKKKKKKKSKKKKDSSSDSDSDSSS